METAIRSPSNTSPRVRLLCSICNTFTQLRTQGLLNNPGCHFSLKGQKAHAHYFLFLGGKGADIILEEYYGYMYMTFWVIKNSQSTFFA